jgi:hypothetical protein
MHKTEALQRTAALRAEICDQEISKGHMGIAVSYMRIAKQEIDAMFVKKGDASLLSKEQREILQKQGEKVAQLLNTLSLKNQKVFKGNFLKLSSLKSLGPTL